MAGDPEKRFHSIMDKLFHAPPKSTSKPPRSISAVGLPRGKKRPNPESALALVEAERTVGSGEMVAPLCRPWDRGDLMRRLATFKSMTWFAKPKVVSAVNCARRGWINVDMDIIGCEACGARLLFSTPASWNWQQVEKAALVFSLKLDNGHKLLCPWIDNACDERLAEFPPTPPPVLVENFRERSAALVQLLALPVVSSSMVNNMRNIQLDEFVKESLSSENANGESLSNQGEADSANLYYQSQKLISLCGWEPRSLPYVVDRGDRGKQLVKDTEVLNLSHIVANPQNSIISVHSAATDKSVDVNEESGNFSGVQSDPNSVVLDCRLCGANVGLWTFTMIPRPMELFRLIGYTEVNTTTDIRRDAGKEKLNGDRGNVASSALNEALHSADGPSNLNFTIAGGPPPTRQNFKAMISFPVIGQNIRARFCYDSEFRDCKFKNQGDAQSGSLNLFVKEKDHRERDTGEQGMELVRSNTHDDGHNSQAHNNDLSSCLNLESGKIEAVKENNSHMPLEQTDITRQEMLSEADALNNSVIMEHHGQSATDMLLGLGKNDKLPENSQNVGSTSSAVGDHSLRSTADKCDQQQIPGEGTLCSNDNDRLDSRDGETCSVSPNTGENLEVYKGIVQTPANAEVASYGRGEDPKQLSTEKAMEFDPIKQHRHFCPWILSTSSGPPGWQQTLSALRRHKEHSDPSILKSPSPSSIIKVDDPIASVRKLFKSPSAKRAKPTHGSG